MTKLRDVRRRPVVNIASGPHRPASSEPNRPSSAVQPFFFGADAELFGCYDPPEGARADDTGVLICAPMGHEYVAAHRALRQLALRIARKDLAVLRFDYYGTGDSAGNTHDVSLRRWRDDVNRAADELRARARCSRIMVIGFRLGASLAATAVAQRDDVSTLVLWDPIIDGGRHLRELFAVQEQWARNHGAPSPLDTSEVLGFRLSEDLRAEIEEIDLSNLSSTSAPRVLIVDTTAGELVGDMVARLEAEGVNVSCSHFDASIRLDEPERVTVPLQLLNAIVDWIATP